MSMFMWSFLVAMTFAAATAMGQDVDKTVELSVKIKNDQAELVVGIDQSAAAWGSMQHTGNITGWNVLDIEASRTGSNGNDTTAYYAAGYLEAALSCNEIGQFSRNNGDITEDRKIRDFAAKSYAYTAEKSRGTYPPGNVSDYWGAVRNILGQFQGIVDGYNRECANTQWFNPLTQSEMFLMQMDGDLEDLQSAYLSSKFHSHRKCTCRLLGYILVPHEAPRIYKTYTLPVKRAGKKTTHSVGFSSSPSWLASIDDWYMTTGTSELAVIETSHGINNKKLYNDLTPKSVLCWIRTIVANTLAMDGNTWAELFSYEHSGTYNNEWQIVDLEKFTPGTKPKEGTGLLTILEEIPGMVHYEDMTMTLSKQGYWPSFNVPYYESIQRAAGYSHSDWANDDRHCLFMQLQDSVVDMNTMEKVMRHNNFKHDKCSHHDPCSGAIACRGDLEFGKQMFGALDAKWSSYGVGYKTLKTHANAGPTHDQQPVFCWPKKSKHAHHGHPACFNFTTAEMVPRKF